MSEEGDEAETHSEVADLQGQWDCRGDMTVSKKQESTASAFFPQQSRSLPRSPCSHAGARTSECPVLRGPHPDREHTQAPNPSSHGK